MRDKTKKDKKKIKLPDLKPVKDPKGGVPPPCGPGGRVALGSNTGN
jgi:hypothetical protein